MTKEQLDALIEFIKEQAAYEAARVTDDEAGYGYVKDAENKLRAAFQTGTALQK